MLDQLTNLVKQFGTDSVVNNTQIPNEQNEAVMNEASSSILSGLKDMVSNGNISDLAGLFQGNNATDNSNPAVKNITNKLSENLGNKFGLSPDTSANVANNLIPQVMGSLVNKAKDPNDNSFQISDIISSISGGDSKTGGGIMDAISKYGTQFGLDQNNDGKVDMSDAMTAVSKKSGGLGGFFSKLMGK